MVRCVERLANSAGHTCSPASSLVGLCPDSRIVPDLRINGLSAAERDNIIDMQIRNPCAKSSFDQNGNPISVARKSERDKRTKQGEAAESVYAYFTRFVMERYGVKAPAASSLFCNLIVEVAAQRSSSQFEAENWSVKTPAALWSQRLSVVLWATQAREIMLLRERAMNKTLARALDWVAQLSVAVDLHKSVL